MTDKQLFAVILSAIFVLSLLASILLPRILRKPESESEPITPPSVIEGEARQNGLALAYPSVNRKNQIKFINIKNQTGEFGFMMYEGDDYHTLYYVNSSGEEVIYYPDICIDNPSVDYTSLFAIEKEDGYSRFTLVDYLCQSLQSPYFDVRIPFETDPEKKNRQFEEFGFSDGGESTVSFSYVNELGETIHRAIKIGEKSVTGTGYYFIVYDNGVERPYIYSSLNNYYSYAVSNMSKFIKPLLVTDGLTEDSGYGPYLTTGYYQWQNQLHDGSCECDKYECPCRGECEGESCECAGICKLTSVTDSSKVISFTDTIAPISSESSESSGYDSTGYKLIEIDLGKYQDLLSALRATSGFVPSYESKNYERAIKALAGREIGEYKDEAEIIFSFVLPRKYIDFGDKDSKRYEYNITAVEAIITDSGEIVTAGARAGEDYDFIKVTYTATLDGKSVSSHPMHAVLDLSGEAIDDATESVLRGAGIGESLDVSFEVEYTAENAVAKSSKYVITEIIDIYDKDGAETDKIKSDSIVGYRYEVYVDGYLTGESTFWLDLNLVTEGEDLKIKNSLIGKSKGRLTLEFEERRAYYEYFLDFVTYKTTRIDAFVKKELVSAFKFQNSSERDPYYGESLYENLLTDERKLYGLSSGVCETVVKILGGLSEESSTATAAGLAGDEVVAIGLTPEVMQKYGLYAHTIYFELPRGIKAYSPGTSDKDESLREELDDYTYRSTLGFNLYVSEVDPETNTRYIASDMYDIVTRVPASDFVFLKYDFETFWARRNIMLVDILDVGEVGVEFNMSDLKGNYTFELTQPKTNKDALGVYVTASGECTPNKFTEFISNPDNKELVYNGGTSLKTLYLYECDAGADVHESAKPDSLGASVFKDVIRLVYLTAYTDILPVEEREKTPDPDSLVMKMTLSLADGTSNASPYTYVYEYYRIDDRRIRVSIYQENLSGEAVTNAVSDFYISSFAFKKIVTNFVGLLNAEVVNTDIGYPDELK